jgi:hypothetical protein
MTSFRSTVVEMGRALDYGLYYNVGKRVDAAKDGIQTARAMATKENLLGVGKVTMIVAGGICHYILRQALEPKKD